ncbi:MAG: WD40 repeat domain-containing protein [Myxococcaceae bacterium]|nr:WD40 repeat domain-containing protein [Myxococcaceae bacterium]
MTAWVLLTATVAAGWTAPPRVLEGHSQSITAVVFSYDGQQVASGAADKEIRVWSVGDGKLLHTLKGLKQGAQALAFSRDGAYLVSGDGGLELKLWNLKTGEAIATWLHREPISSLLFSADGNHVWVGGMGDQGAVYSVPDGQKVKDLPVRSLAAPEHGVELIAGTRSGRIVVYPKALGAPKTQLSTGSHVPAVAVSADGSTVLSRDQGQNEVLVWNLSRPKDAPVKLEGHQRGLTSLAVSADGSRAVSASLDGSVRLWDVKNRKELSLLRGQGALFAAVSPDFKRLAVGEGRYLKLWELPQ